MNGPTYSEDGQWVWDGNDWVPVAQPNVPINNVPNQYNHQMQVNPQQMQVNPQSYSQTPGQVVVYSSPKSSSSKPIIIVVSLVIGVALLVVLAGVLYVWASSLAEDEIEGKWYDDDGEWIEFSSGDKFECSSGCNFDEWRMGENSGEVAFCIDDSNADGGGCDGSWYYTYEYEVKGDVLFLARHDSVGNIGECIIFVKSGNSYSDTYDSETSPSWC
tara:strand:- start:1592 stop:2239 length:648 start_codon:yes stop_codon:yes gene_type:complete